MRAPPDLEELKRQLEWWKQSGRKHLRADTVKSHIEKLEYVIKKREENLLQ